MTPLDWVLLVFLGLFGLAIGSFICVIIDRLPYTLDEPNEYGELVDTRAWREVFGGTSRCSSCGEPVRPMDNIPVVSWLVLRGRCRGCGDRIPAFHPIVELLVPIVAIGLAIGIGKEWLLIPALLLVAPAIAVAAIDLRVLIVPTRIIWPTFLVEVIACVAIAIALGHPEWIWGAALGVAVLAGPLFLLWWFQPSGMGFGDVRLTVLLGWVLGFSAAYFGAGLMPTVLLVLVTMVGSAVLGIILGLAGSRETRKVPFGPPLVIATFVAIALASRFAEPFVSAI